MKYLFFVVLVAFFIDVSFSQRVVVFNEKGELTDYYSSRFDLKEKNSDLFSALSSEKQTIRDQKKNRKTIFIISSSKKGNYFLNHTSSTESAKRTAVLKHGEIMKFESLTVANSSKTQYYSCVVETEPELLNYQIVKYGNDDFESPLFKVDTATVRRFLYDSNPSDTLWGALNLEQLFKVFLSDALKGKEGYVNKLDSVLSEIKEFEAKLKRNAYHSPADSAMFVKEKSDLEWRIQLYEEHYKNFPDNKDCESCSSYATDSILVWKKRLRLIKGDWEIPANEDRKILEELKQEKSSLLSALKFSSLKSSFLNTYKLRQPLIMILHQGILPPFDTDHAELFYTKTSSEVAGNYSNIKLKPISKPDWLSYETKLNVFLANAEKDDFTKNVSYNTMVDMSGKITEDELAEGGWVYALQESPIKVPDSFQGMSEETLNITDLGFVSNLEFQRTVIQKGGIQATELQGKRHEETYTINVKDGPWSEGNQPKFRLVCSGDQFPEDTLVDWRVSFYYKININDSIEFYRSKFSGVKLRSLKDSIPSFEEFIGDVISEVIQSPLNPSDLQPSFNPFMVCQLKDHMDFVEALINTVPTTVNSDFYNYFGNNFNVKRGLVDDTHVKYSYPIYNKEGFDPLSKPKVTVSTSGYDIGEKKYTVSGGKVKQEDYSFTFNGQKEIGLTTLPAARKKYRFSISAGAGLSTFTTYSYEIFQLTQFESVNPYAVREYREEAVQVVPTVFFSVYPWKFDVFAKTKRNWYRRFEFGLGLDYKDKDLLDNFYVTGGWTPHRAIHFVFGARIGQSDQLDYSGLNPFEITTSSVQENLQPTWNQISWFAGVNLGVDLIPSFISKLF